MMTTIIKDGDYAESLEWVAYGSCGHKDVCSTCVARLRLICTDRRCCICKSDSSVIYVTKALGEYTKTISDFSVFPLENKEGGFGSYWYHEDTQSYFDDFDQYKMIKAMCRLSCSVCDKMEDNSSSKSKRKARFRDIYQLKDHLFHQHSLLMCRLCLEGRKVFICEQKLYSKAQLKQHIDTGDSEVDGSESESGGFQGHPFCEFCRSPFCGDNELYTHMNTEHFKCHICQRQNHGKYEYYKSYDDLEASCCRQNHLFPGCGFSHGVWSAIGRWCGLTTISAFQVKDFLDMSIKASDDKRGRKVIQSIFIVTMWLLWDARNKMIFNNKKPKVHEVMSTVKSMSFFWIKNRSRFKNIVWKDWFENPLYMFVNG